MAVQFIVPDHLRDDLSRRFRCAHWVSQGRFVGPAIGQFERNLFRLNSVPRCGRHLQLPWRVKGYGEIYVRAPQLMEREEPYRLSAELARGQLTIAREFVAQCRLKGIPLPDSISESLSKACETLMHGIRQSDIDTSDVLCNSALQQAIVAADQAALASCEARTHSCKRAVTLNDRRCFDFPLDAFQHFNVPVCWRDIEQSQGNYYWEFLDHQIDRCCQLGIPFTVGPLVGFHHDSLPDWLLSWADDIDLIVTLMSNFVETIIHRYGSRVESWETSSGVNTEDLLEIGEEKLARILLQILRVANDLAPHAELSLTIDQPWGEFMYKGQRRFSPFCVIDSMLRTCPPLRAINLDVTMGYPCLGGMRTLLDFSRMLDHYSDLHLPLRVSLRFPSEKQVQGTCQQCNDLPFCELSQADWLEKFFTIARSKPMVDMVVLGEMIDPLPKRRTQWPFAGLINSDGVPKESWERSLMLCDPHHSTVLHGISQ